MWKNSVVREMGFKANFLLWILVEGLWFALQLCFFTVIYSHTEHIADWTKWQVVLLIGTSHLVQQLFQAFFLVNITQLSELIRTGKLDFMLLLPVNTRFIVSLRQVDLGGFVNAGMAACVIGYALHRLSIAPTAVQLLCFALLVVAGALMHYSLMLLLASVSFWTVRAQGIVWGYYSLFNIARLPDAAFRGFFKVFFTFAVPILLVANVPARLLAQTLATPGRMLLVLVMCVTCFIVSELGWRFALKHYTSASS
ncbi:MAG TPA: ABC-2 family transporter protein [Candidatus Acidoferrum sp.]|nr:ABC-2 family transporter protein [Candidatus Acidoferrum sp.]